MKIFGVLWIVVTVAAAIIVVPVPPGPPPSPPTHAFVNTDADGLCDEPLVWWEGFTRHTQCDQSHSDPYNVPSHVNVNGQLYYLGPGTPADNNYH